MLQSALETNTPGTIKYLNIPQIQYRLNKFKTVAVWEQFHVINCNERRKELSTGQKGNINNVLLVNM